MVLTSVLMVANWWPCSESMSLSTRLGPLDLGGVVLALHRQADLFLLEAVEHVGVGDGVEALVIDLADGGPFPDEDVQDDALLRVFALDAQILEVAGVPQRVEVALDGDRIVGVAGMSKEPRQDGLLGNAPVADDPNLIDGLRSLGQGGDRGKRQDDKQRNPRHARCSSGCGPQCAGDGSVLDLHRAGALRRAQVLVRSMVRLHGKNMHTLIAKNLVLLRGKNDYIGPWSPRPNLRPIHGTGNPSFPEIPAREARWVVTGLHSH